MEPERMIGQQADLRLGWLRSVVFLANGGIMAVAGLIAGMAAAGLMEEQVLVAGVAALVAGAVAVASAEYGAAIARTDGRLAPLAPVAVDPGPVLDVAEMAALYRARGLSPELAQEAALAAAEHGAPASAVDGVRPIEAALAAATSFGAGAAVPVTIASAFPADQMALGVGAASAVVAMMLAGLCTRGTEASLVRVLGRVAFGCACAVIGGHLVGLLLGPALA